jgi:1,4-alpha-glucan branching enzyme
VTVPDPVAPADPRASPDQQTPAEQHRISDLDLFLLSQGRHERLWRVLGAHPVEGGVTFAVWAPNAAQVYVDGDFTGWDLYGGVELHRQGPSGVWAGFAPGARTWQRYKFRLLGADGVWRQKADPMAQHTECPPATASMVFASGYEWGDAEWMARRADRRPHQEPMSMYEVHLGSWRPGLSYVELADQLVGYVRELGFTHVELMPVMEHPYGGSWGYQITGFYAPTSRFGNPDDLRYLIDRLHQAGIGVLLDWVPAHFPRDEFALARFDGTPLYEHPDPRRGEHPDWGSLIFDYGRPEVRNFLLANALFWCSEFHADGLRVDAVSSMLYLDYSRGYGQWEPNVFGGNEHLEAISFLRELNQAVYRENPGVVMIAEESAAWPSVSRPVDYGGLGFGLKWNLGWMHDTLEYLVKDPVHRMYHHDRLTLPSVYAFTENFVLPLSHDEVVYGKRSLVSKLPGDRWQRLAGLRGLLAYQWAYPGKQLLFMGAELAQESEWSEQAGLDWSGLADAGGTGVSRLLRDLNLCYREAPAIWSRDCEPDGFRWLVSDGPGNVLAFLRRGADGDVLACLVNFSPVPRLEYPVGLPLAGRWWEVINTDAACYGGSGVGNLGEVTAAPSPRDGQPASATVHLGPFAAVWLAPASC